MKKLVAIPGALLFLASCALVRGGLFDSARYGDAAYYGHYAHEMASGKWPYRDFFDEYPVLAQPPSTPCVCCPGRSSRASSGRWHSAARRRSCSWSR